MKILVTGSNGLLGQKLTTLLAGNPGVKLIATAKGQSAVPIIHGEFYSLDISDAEEVNKVVASTRPDIIINTAAMTQVDPCELDKEGCRKANVTGVENIIRAARDHGAHLIHVSTDFIFDGTQPMLDEQAAPNPVNYYGQCKLEGELLVQQSGIPWCIIRTVLVYGITHDMSRSNIVLWVKRSLEQGKAIQVVADQWRTPTLAEDLAEGCYLAAQKKATGVYHIAGKDYLSVYEIALHTARFFKLDSSLIKPTDSAAFKQPGQRPAKTGFVIEKARHELGYEPHSFDEGLQVVASQLR